MRLILRLCFAIAALLVSGCSQPSPSAITVAVDAHEEWQDTSVNLSTGNDVVIEYVDGEWTNWLGEIPFFGPTGGPSFICGWEACVEPLIGYPQGGLIGRVGFGEPFAVGDYVAFTAETDGMLQLRMYDAGTYDNKGSVLMRVSLDSTDECGIWLDTGMSDFAFSFDFTAGCI